MICLFAARMSLQHGQLPMIIKQGVTQEQTMEQSFDNFFSNALGDDYQGLDGKYLSNNKYRVFERTKREW